MHIYLVICLIKTIFNAICNIIKGFKLQLMIKFFWMIMVKNCHLNFGNQVTFYLRGSFGSATCSSGFLFVKLDQNNSDFSLNVCFDKFLLLDELFLDLEQLRLTNFVKFYLNYQTGLELFY